MDSRLAARAFAALLALEAAPAAEIVPALERVLADNFGAAEVRVLLADYRQTALQDVSARTDGSGPGWVPVDGTSLGRTFASQNASVAESGSGFEAEVPVTARSDRLGVLAVTLPRKPSADEIEALTAIARALAHAMSVANRHTDLFEAAARSQRLSLAAEIQWQILPGRGCGGPDFDVAGQLEPAYHVAGDAFDWSVATEAVTVSVHEGMSSGTAAAMATNLAVTALRNARRSGMSLAEQASMADEALYGIYHGAHHIESLLLRFDRSGGPSHAIDAGSPLLLRQRGDNLEQVTFDKQLPLGRFSGTRYREQQFEAVPGDRFIALTDGVHEAPGADAGRFGEAKLGSVLRSSRRLGASETVRQLIRELRSHYDDGDIGDDAAAVVIDWNG